ncbi:hypothetical protein HZS_5641 [Henneguya salminicola]|nr:hypothetical protein HZS_5641 [Henneguya salminicola]
MKIHSFYLASVISSFLFIQQARSLLIDLPPAVRGIIFTLRNKLGEFAIKTPPSSPITLNLTSKSEKDLDQTKASGNDSLNLSSSKDPSKSFENLPDNLKVADALQKNKDSISIPFKVTSSDSLKASINPTVIIGSSTTKSNTMSVREDIESDDDIQTTRLYITDLLKDDRTEKNPYHREQGGKKIEKGLQDTTSQSPVNWKDMQNAMAMIMLSALINRNDLMKLQYSIDNLTSNFVDLRSENFFSDMKIHQQMGLLNYYIKRQVHGNSWINHLYSILPFMPAKAQRIIIKNLMYFQALNSPYRNNFLPTPFHPGLYPNALGYMSGIGYRGFPGIPATPLFHGLPVNYAPSYLGLSFPPQLYGPGYPPFAFPPYGLSYIPFYSSASPYHPDFERRERKRQRRARKRRLLRRKRRNEDRRRKERRYRYNIGSKAKL